MSKFHILYQITQSYHFDKGDVYMENNTGNVVSTSCCGCVGYAYVPVQILDDIYSVSKALVQGTIFPELDLSIDEYGKVCKGGVSK